MTIPINYYDFNNYICSERKKNMHYLFILRVEIATFIYILLFKRMFW